MIVTCHQPNYLPHLGFFHKMKQADVFILLDTVQFSDGFYQHRNRIRTENGWKWLTIPVERTFQPIKDVRIKNNVLISGRQWQEFHWSMIQQMYNHTPYFKKLTYGFTPWYQEHSFEYLVDFTTALITHIKDITNITTPLIRASTLQIEEPLDASDRLAKLTKAAGGTCYLAGPSGGIKYELREEPFQERGISIAHQHFAHPVYEQYHGKQDGLFEKNLAAIDALFNVGSLLL
ncbi:MAG: hypothetical protein A3J54_01275 [Candidatus Ryanbacteria bacterium RIFCSPHIGHO2_02_FULL_45_13b]|uniref:WbqC-like protein n=1 Tax=Candidatus Ryanbacteria bacterium RIFCSPHIGHO2_02_FULL_45_13b TaxID=1802117 RepID=A0A1G2GAD4_9BACT|nr:MAG: hypothetical protein A3J54_01275 [Candidatus Ryanbacteria bacterium RIFCSPHIGHO2_02_FULL_45_13b]